MRLLLRVTVFTLVLPGVYAVLVPLLLVRHREAASGAMLVLSLCLLALGAAAYVRCAWDFAVVGKGTPAPFDAPKRLVIRGLYRYTRNPMYLAFLTVIAGWAALFRAVILVGYGMVLFALFALGGRFHEEPRMARQFGEEYVAYAAAVPRWLPRRPDKWNVWRIERGLDFHSGRPDRIQAQTVLVNNLTAAEEGRSVLRGGPSRWVPCWG